MLAPQKCPQRVCVLWWYNQATHHAGLRTPAGRRDGTTLLFIPTGSSPHLGPGPLQQEENMVQNPPCTDSH